MFFCYHVSQVYCEMARRINRWMLWLVDAFLLSLWIYFRLMIGRTTDHSQAHWKFRSSLVWLHRKVVTVYCRDCFSSSSSLLSCLQATSSFIYIWSIGSSQSAYHRNVTSSSPYQIL
mmetsp:Transcript_6349/g.9268  ORF Transcript_6349/g.9268 Transcript_6349/m.9268 type:complete len:117 (+) Transcript_6349:385-735(+)